MRLRCGIDLVSVERIARLERELGPEMLERIFGGKELLHCRAHRFPERRLAERFAAKEACLKLFPQEAAAGELGVEDIAVLDGQGRALRIEPGARLRQAMERHGIAGIAISTASSRGEACAIAVVVAAADEGEAEPAPAAGPELRRAVEAVRRLERTLPGRLAYRLLPIRRRVILANVARVFGGALRADEVRRLAEAFYSHMARFLLETVTFSLKPIRRWAERVRVENIEIPLAAARAGHGLLLLTGHLGNWEVATMAGILQFPQYRGKFHFLRRPISTRWIESLVLRRFRSAGLGVIPKKNSLGRILDVLEKGEILVFIMDQHASVPKDGIAVEFFGRPAGTFRSLAILARASGAPVIPAHAFREPDGSHVLRFEEPLPWVSHLDPAEEVRLNTRAYNRALERMVLAHPEQWFWMHKRWKL